MSLAEYFKQNRYRSKYHIGDRVTGKYMSIPFMGSVGNDGLVSEIDGPMVTVHLDLPIRLDDKIINVVKVDHSSLRPLK